MNTDEEIFQCAAALPAAERSAYLDAACAGQPELRARIEALLRSHDASGFMEAGATEARRPDFTAECVRFQPEQSGERIGRYRLLQQIGEGGFGVVWMAEQVEPVTRRASHLDEIDGPEDIFEKQFLPVARRSEAVPPSICRQQHSEKQVPAAPDLNL